jgi:toxin-associated regulator BotR
MSKDLYQKITIFKNKSNNFMDIFAYFESKINYLSYKLKYPEAATDFIIYLYELLIELDLSRLIDDESILKYVRKCLRNKSTKLYYKINVDKSHIVFNSDVEVLESIEKINSRDDYSNIIFNDLISFLKPRQKQIVFYKFYLQLSDIEISKILQISRQAINKSEKIALKTLRTELFKDGCYV